MGNTEDKIDQDVATAVVFFAAALIERCEALLRRLGAPEKVAEEIEAFRQAATRSISVHGSAGLTPDRQEASIRLAHEHVEEICRAWCARTGAGEIKHGPPTAVA